VLSFTFVGAYQTVLIGPRDYENISASWPTGVEWRVIDVWSALMSL